MLCFNRFHCAGSVDNAKHLDPLIHLHKRDELLFFSYRLSLQTEARLASTARQSPDPGESLMATLLRAPPVNEQASLDMRIWLGFHRTGAGNPRGSCRFGAG